LRILEVRAGLDTPQRDYSVTVQALCIDAFAGGEIACEFAESFAELAGGADRIASLGVVQADREVDEGLEEEAARAALRGPDFLPDFVALEEAAGVEEVDAALQQFVHDAT
jgi:hypothetical protein